MQSSENTREASTKKAIANDYQLKVYYDQSMTELDKELKWRNKMLQKATDKKKSDYWTERVSTIHKMKLGLEQIWLAYQEAKAK